VYVTTIIGGYDDTPYHRKLVGAVKLVTYSVCNTVVKGKIFKKNFKNLILWKRAFGKFIIIERSTQF